MNKEAKALWLAWLRDPSHKQATHQLHTDEGFCCLGGLSECAPFGEWLDREEEAGFFFLSEGVFNLYNLTTDVMKWSGLETAEGVLEGTRAYSIAGNTSDDPETLAYLNDNGLTFLQIADVIDVWF